MCRSRLARIGHEQGTPYRQPRVYRVASISVLLVVALVAFASRDRVQAQVLPTFAESECMVSSAFSFLGAETARCGYVTVPERRLGSQGTNDTSIRLAVVVLPATGAGSVEDPLFVAQGGPGGSTIDVFVDLLATSPLRAARDIVLFDQRGTLYSEPNLICTEFQARMGELFAASDAEYPELLASVITDCRTRLVEAGVDLGAYNSLENAADVDDIRRALGYDTINFYGVSYGTLLGLHLMRDYPAHLRSVILDGVVPTQINFITEVAASEDRVFTALFDACAADTQCHARYGDLRTRFFALVEELNDAPALVTLLNPTTGERFRVPFFGDDLVDFVFQMFYWSGSPAVLPKLMHDAENGRFGYVEAVLSSVVFDDTFSDGMYNSVLCAEDVDFVPEATTVEGVHPTFSEGFEDELKEIISVCELWDVPALGAALDEPVVSAIPTLLLSGSFDPITPPRFGAVGAATLANGYHVVLPTGGHGVAFGTDTCVDQIVDSFLTMPQTPPDDACLPPAQFDFVSPDAVVVPLLAYINMLNGAALRRAGVAALLFAVVLSAFVVWPLGWFMRNLRGTSLELSPDQRRRRLRARLLVLGFGSVVLAFGTLFGVSVAASVLANDAYLMLGAVSGYARSIFALLWALVPLAVMIAAAAVEMWVHRRSTPIARLYYSVLAVAAVCFTWILMQDGMMSLVLPW